jgi:hypothetical protein
MHYIVLLCYYLVHFKKGVSPSPAGMSLTANLFYSVVVVPLDIIDYEINEV